MLGVPVTVSVDELLTFRNDKPDVLYYGTPGLDGALWMPILEKAAAKMYGNYEMLSGGLMGPAVQMLTGAPYYDKMHYEYKTSDELWSYIDEKIKAKWMVTCASHYGTGSDKDFNEIGLPYVHAYTVLGTHQLSNGQKLVKVRNPFGPLKETFHGDWSDDSDKWTDSFKAEVNYENSNDGVWFISAEDYKSSM